MATGPDKNKHDLYPSIAGKHKRAVTLRKPRTFQKIPNSVLWTLVTLTRLITFGLAAALSLRINMRQLVPEYKYDGMTNTFPPNYRAGSFGFAQFWASDFDRDGREKHAAQFELPGQSAPTQEPHAALRAAMGVSAPC